MQDSFKKLVLSVCDVLVDGPYKYSLRDTSLAFRGSSNQRIIYLNDYKERLDNKEDIK